MTIFAVYQLEDGRLVSSTQDQTKLASAAILAARGYGVAQRPDSELNGAWQPATLSFAPPAPAPTEISTSAFILRFESAEYAGIKASADPQIGQWLLAIGTTQTIDLSDAVVQKGIEYLTTLSPPILTAARATAILTP